MRKSTLDGEEFKEYEQFAIEDTLLKTEIPKELEPRNTRIQPTSKPDLLVLYPENTSNYSRMPLQFRVGFVIYIFFCSHAIAPPSRCHIKL